MSPAVKPLLSVLASGAVLVLAMPSVARAAEVDEPLAESGMRIVGFDAEVARAHGYEVVTLPDGALASVPADKAEAARTGEYVPTAGVLSPKGSEGGISANAYGEASGNCGTSWVQLIARGGGSAGLTTGMSLVIDSGGPWDVHWNVDISDNGGNSTQRYSESDGYFGTLGLSWAGKARSLKLTKGWANATVTSGSFTVTEAGWVCFSYSPTVSTTIT